MANKNTYHERAQKFIKSAKSKGMTVKAEKGELVAYPANYKKPTLIQKVEMGTKNVIKNIGKGMGKVMSMPRRASTIESNMQRINENTAKENVSEMNGYRNVPISAPKFKKPTK